MNINDLSRELDRVKNDIYRKAEGEDLRRLKSDVDKLDSTIRNINSELSHQRDLITRILEKLEI